MYKNLTIGRKTSNLSLKKMFVNFILASKVIEGNVKHY